MTRKKSDPSKGQPSAPKQVNFRAPPDLFDRLEDTADAFGLDVSNFIRMVLLENLPTYEQRAGQIRQRRKGGE